MKKSFFQGIAFMAVFFLFACNGDKKELVKNAPPVTNQWKDDTGKEIKLDHAVQKAVSLAPSVTEMIFAIGGEKKLIARSQACNYPEKANALPVITTFPALDVEKLKSLNPDIVITTNEIFSPDAIALLEKQNIKVYQQSYSNMKDIYRCMKETGKLLDCEANAIKAADSLENIEKKVWSMTQNLAKYRTMILVSDEPLKVIGGTGYLNELIVKSGGTNIFKDKNDPYPTTTVEEIMSLQPEYIIIPTNDTEAYTKLIMKYPPLYNTVADMQKHIFITDPDVYYRPGPRTTMALLDLTHILHSQLTPDKFTTEK
ncbi:MAG: helical backbone metal receptor [Bacteroidia bacterium]|nr:helical backbone metal receptor [Bacteroidia bacterium]